MFFIVDRSKSMRWVPNLCRSAPGGNPFDSDSVACWNLFLKFIDNIVKKTLAIPYRDTVLGWKDDSPGVTRRGVRVWLYAFACTGHQSVPVTLLIGEKITNQNDFDFYMQKASEMIPDGGTCPGAAIERVAAMVQGNDLLERKFKTSILLTDGVFYDMPRPKIATQGLLHFGVLTYAMGISIPNPTTGEDYGLTPNEIKVQRSQLMTFVNNDDTRLFNFGLGGLNLLDDIAQEFADQLPYDIASNFPNILKHPYWCGWTSVERCTNLNPIDTSTGEHCKWLDSVTPEKCVDKQWCNYGNQPLLCKQDPNCNWLNALKKCVAKPLVG